MQNIFPPFCLLHCFTVAFDFDPLPSISAISLSLPSLLDLGPASFILSALFHPSIRFTSDLPCIFKFQQQEGASVCFSLFSCVLHSPLTKECMTMTLFGVCSPSHLNVLKKITDCFLQAVCVSNIRSLLSSRGMQFITLTES